jgi:hypothetical protein
MAPLAQEGFLSNANFWRKIQKEVEKENKKKCKTLEHNGTCSDTKVKTKLS